MLLKNTAVLPLLVLAAMLSASCNNTAGEGHDHAEEADDAHVEGTIHFSEEQARAAAMTLDTVRPSDFAEVLPVSGHILPAQGGEMTVSATMAGVVSLSSADLTEGAAVSAGQPIFVIAANELADGNPAAAAAAELKAARAAYDRAKSLAEDRLVSNAELEEARRRLETAEAAAASLGNATRRRTAAAPMAGYVKSILVRPGDYVEAGRALAVVSTTRRLQLRADVPERDYARLADVDGANFRLTADAPGTVHRLADLRGRLVARGQTTADGDCYVPVVFEFDNVGDIVPGTFADVWLLGRRRSGVISIPLRAVTEEQGVTYVYLRTGPNDYKKTEVKTGADDGNRVEITAGLREGDVVVVDGAIQVKLAAAGSTLPEGHNHSH